MAQRLRKSLVKCTPAQRKAILKEVDDALVKTICECLKRTKRDSACQ